MEINETYLKERLASLTQKRGQQMQQFQQLQSQMNIAQAQMNATEGAIMDVQEMLGYAKSAPDIPPAPVVETPQEAAHVEDTSQ